MSHLRTIPTEVVYVTDVSDLPAPSAGVYTLAADTTYIFCNEVDLTGDRIVCSENTVLRGWSSENCRVKSTGLTGTALITSVYSLPILNLTIEADVALDLNAADPNYAIDWNGVNFTSCATVGTIANYGNVIFVNCALLSSANLTFDGTIGTVGIDGTLLSGIAGQTTISIPATATITRRFRIIYSAIVAFGGATALDVSASATIPVESYILDTVNFSGGATYISGVQHSDNKALFTNCKGISNSASTGMMTMSGNSTNTTITTIGTPVKIAGTTALDSSVTQRFDMPTDNRLTYTGAITRQFRTTAVLTISSGGNNKELGTTFALNGTVITTSKMTVTSDGAGRAENAVIQTVVTLEENDYLELFVQNDDSTNNITVSDFNMIVEALN